ncbi:MAG TPA: hypothetical protein VFF37_05775 [Streptomyces sp.]|nr:hypothetical protein [Gemmatimonadales bacterium]HZX37833.1 hypothetical protein [Streptomyces sp.]
MNETLAKARATAAEMLLTATGEPRPTWRVIITDSESPTGIAPVCTAEGGDALHMILDYPGGPMRDEEGVYDCCPWPQVDTYSTAFAAYLVELLNADAEATPAGFFQVGHVYTREHHGQTVEFTVRSVEPWPGRPGQWTAFGFRSDPFTGTEPMDSDDPTTWTDTANSKGGTP